VFLTFQPVPQRYAYKSPRPTRKLAGRFLNRKIPPRCPPVLQSPKTRVGAIRKQARRCPRSRTQLAHPRAFEASLPPNLRDQSGSIWRATLFGWLSPKPYGVIGKDLRLRANRPGRTAILQAIAECGRKMTSNFVKRPRPGHFQAACNFLRCRCRYWQSLSRYALMLPVLADRPGQFTCPSLCTFILW
jgi:hypothetical protein